MRLLSVGETADCRNPSRHTDIKYEHRRSLSGELRSHLSSTPSRLALSHPVSFSSSSLLSIPSLIQPPPASPSLSPISLPHLFLPPSILPLFFSHLRLCPISLSPSCPSSSLSRLASSPVPSIHLFPSLPLTPALSILSLPLSVPSLLLPALSLSPSPSPFRVGTPLSVLLRGSSMR